MRRAPVIVALAVFALAVVVAASAALYFVNERSVAQQRAESQQLRDTAVSACERVNVRVDAVIRTLKIVTAGDDVPQSDIGVRLFAAIDALQESEPGDCATVTP